MPPPKPHYQIALADYNGDHSWVVHSAKGITWSNIPDDLETLLKTLAANQLLDVSLGSGGRWFVRYRFRKGPDRQAFSNGLPDELNLGANVKIDRVALGPVYGDYWGVHRAPNGSFERFRSTINRNKFENLLDAKTATIKSNNQIHFVSLGFNGDYAFSVNGFVQHRCNKPLHDELRAGWKLKKRVSTMVLSTHARIGIIVWEDGTISHNLPPNIAAEVDDYCKLQHSLKSNDNAPNQGGQKGPKGKGARNGQLGPTATGAGAARGAQQPAIGSSNTNTASGGLLSGITSATTQGSNTQPSQPPHTQPSALSQSTKPLPTSTTPSFLRPPNSSATSALPTSSTPNQQPTSTSTLISGYTAGLTRSTPMQPAFPNPNGLSIPPTRSRTTHAPPNTTTYSTSVTPSAVTSQPGSTTYQTKISARRYLDADLYDDDDDYFLSSYLNYSKRHHYVTPRRLKTSLVVLDPDRNWLEYEKVRNLFVNGWKHSHKKCPKVKRIFSVLLPDSLEESYDAYKARLQARHGSDNEKLLFHGTHNRCLMGDAEAYKELCEAPTCKLCAILGTSFLVSKAGSAGRAFKRFGAGIYTSSVSSKADDYSLNVWSTDYKALIVARVALGRGKVIYSTTEDLTGPPVGYDSVLGEPGVSLNYDEQVLYNDDAVRPAYVIVYEQPTIVSTSTSYTITRPQPAQTQTFQSTTVKPQYTPAPPKPAPSSSSSGRCTFM